MSLLFCAYSCNLDKIKITYTFPFYIWHKIKKFI